MSGVIAGAAETAAPILPDPDAAFFTMQGVGKRFGSFDALKETGPASRRFAT